MKPKYARIFMKLLIICFLSAALIPSNQAQAAVLKVRYHDTTYSYTGTSASVSVDGKTIDLDGCPGLIIDNTALFPLEEVFGAAIGANTSFDSESGEILISGFGKELLMYIDSTQAYLNGKKITLTTPPLSVKYIKAGKTKILVPARTAAEALGFGYSWKSSGKCAEITRPFQLYYDMAWVNYEDVQGKVTINGTKVSLGKMPAIKLDGCIMVPAKKVFAAGIMDTEYSYQESSKQAEINGNGIKITLTVDSTKAVVNGSEKNLPTAPKLVINSYNNVSYMMVPVKFLAEQLGYYYNWDSSAKTVEIFTSEEQMLEIKGYYFSEECTNEFSKYAASLPVMDKSYSLEASGKNASITKVFYNENLPEYGERYIIAADRPLGEIETVLDKEQIIVTCKNTLSTDNSYGFGNPVIQSAATAYDSSTGTTIVTLQASSDKINYYISLSDDQCNLYIDIYKNCLMGITAQKWGNQEVLSLTGAASLEGSYTQENQLLTIVFPHTFSGLASKTFSGTDNSYIKNVTLEDQEDGSLAVSVSCEGGFYIQVSNTRYQIVFYGDSNNQTDAIAGNFDIYIPLPSGVEYTDITDNDPYADKKFQFLIRGDYQSFYKQNTIISNNDAVSKIKIALNSTGTKTVITIQTTKIRGYHFYDANGAIGVSLGSLRKMYQNIVLFDAGHGGKDSGAVNGKYQEKDFNLTILYKKMKPYFQSGNVKAFWTRIDDTFIDLYERPKISAKAKADIFISLHMNSASSASAKGLEVYYSKNNKNKSDSNLTSEKMAAFFQESLISKIGCYDRGYKSAEYVVVKYNTVPSVLIELGFISNSADLARLKDGQKQEKAAKAIYDTIVELFEEYPTGR